MELGWLVLLIPFYVVYGVLVGLPLAMVGAGAYFAWRFPSAVARVGGAALIATPFLIKHAVDASISRETSEREAALAAIPREPPPSPLPRTLVIRSDDFSSDVALQFLLFGHYGFERLIFVYGVGQGREDVTVARLSSIEGCDRFVSRVVSRYRQMVKYRAASADGKKSYLPYGARPGDPLLPRVSDDRCVTKTSVQGAVPYERLELRTDRATSFRERHHLGSKFELVQFKQGRMHHVDLYEYRPVMRPVTAFCLALASPCRDSVRPEGAALSLPDFLERALGAVHESRLPASTVAPPAIKRRLF